MNDKVTKFWEWFVANNEELTMLSEHSQEKQQQLLEELQRELTNYCDGLSFEMGEQTKNGRKVVFSAEGDVELFRYVVELVEEAPDLDWWEFIPFKQPHGKYLKVHFEKYYFETKKMYFQFLENEEEPDILGVRVALNMPEKYDDDLLVGVYVTLEALIGEFDCATLLGYLDVCPVPADLDKDGFAPLDKFPEFIEWFKKERDK